MVLEGVCACGDVVGMSGIFCGPLNIGAFSRKYALDSTDLLIDFSHFSNSYWVPALIHFWFL
jgi:hypothetical protein